MTKDTSRSAYTKRIMEIVANITKQKEEITKVMKDCCKRTSYKEKKTYDI